jgi:formylglycine-generating enzyme required for sulfatase activity
MIDPSNPPDTETRQDLIVHPSSGLVGLPEGRSAPLEEMILRSLAHLSETAGLIAPEPRPGEERDFPIASGVNMRMCWCPPGDFIMGSPEPEQDMIDYGIGTDVFHDENQVEVSLTRGFWMGKTAVTQEQWEAVMGSNPSHFKGASRPVEKVNWYDTQMFLERVNAYLGALDGGKMALPTEAQWEYAARAGKADHYPRLNLSEVAWYDENSNFKTHPVGTKKANSWGLHDLLGNVWEWCQNAYWEDDYLLRGGVDPAGPESGPWRVLRGNSWNSAAADCRFSYRSHDYPADWFPTVGFRIARI